MKKIFKLLAIIPLCLVLYLESLGQGNLEDAVYLKNGKVFRGLIIEQIPGKSIKIKISGDEVHLFYVDEIEKITKEKIIKNKVSLDEDEVIQPKFSNNTELLYSVGVGDVKLNGYNFKNKLWSRGVRTVNGIKFSDNASIGVGLGLDFYENFTLVPITFDSRFSFSKYRIRPLINLNIGYSAGKYDGAVFNTSVGFKTILSSDISLFMMVGYKNQTSSIGSGKNEKFLYYQYVSWSAGISF
jgi:hypothetical protein